MADVKIVKFKVRRGTEIQRPLIILDQGELGYTIDTKRLFCGDGVTLGGKLASSVNFTPVDSSQKTNLSDAYIGDIVCENGLMWQLTAANYAALSSWSFIGTKVDDSTLQYTPGSNIARVKPNGINVEQLGNVVYNQGGIVKNSTYGLSANVDQATITVNGSNKISISAVPAYLIVGEIDRTQFNADSIANIALSAGVDNTLNVVADNDSIIINGSNALQVQNISATMINSGLLSASQISSRSLAGRGLRGGEGTPLSAHVDDFSITITGNGIGIGSIGGNLVTYGSISGERIRTVSDSITLSSSSLIVKSLFNVAKLPLSGSSAAFGGFFTPSSATGTQYNVVTATSSGEINTTQQASASAMVLSTGEVALIYLIDFGRGYDSNNPPRVTLSAGNTVFSYASASAIINPTTTAISAISITDSGSGYVHANVNIQIDPPSLVLSPTFQLSAAGFMMLDFGTIYGKMAIPVFSVPSALQNITINDVSIISA